MVCAAKCDSTCANHSPASPVNEGKPEAMPLSEGVCEKGAEGMVEKRRENTWNREGNSKLSARWQLPSLPRRVFNGLLLSLSAERYALWSYDTVFREMILPKMEKR
ncbi:Hypothetical predicted protein [Octopus vulgaris]|uniref:Uncharacterized protein n=1 Tax=Octopus vulgaris TaxID=6645 RepID=A0AA36F7Q2_OCTVU|nr:Hypothetical predicted protein [Octopus vulgaris]